MVNNYDRILTEIKKEAQRSAPEHNIDPDALVSLAMEIVDLEDQNRIKNIARIKQRIEGLILTTAMNQMLRRGTVAMLRLCRIEIDNLVCFDNVVIEPSTDPERPLTVLRAENGSGKTTFLRALRWGMYGEKGLPGNSTRFSLHPAWWRPTDAGIKTKVLVEFETDGSTRHTEGNSATTVYQLVRSVTTIGKPASRDDEPDFRRINEHTQLMVKEGDGTWTPHTSGS